MKNGVNPCSIVTGFIPIFLNEKEQWEQQIIKEKTYFCNNRINKE